MSVGLLLSRLGFIIGTLCGIYNICNVIKFLGKNYMKGIRSLYALFFLVITYLSLVLLNDKNSYFIIKYPRFVILGFGLIFAKLMSLMQLSHIMEVEYKPLYFTNVFPLLTILIHSILYSLGINIISIDYIIPVFFIWNLISWLHFIYYCSEEMCEILNINRLTIGKRHKDKKLK